MLLNQYDTDMRKALFTPCESKEHLALWIKTFLGLWLPDSVVADDSNSSPMDLIWEVYSKCRQNDDESFYRIMAYANRGGFKTLGASVLEILIILHLNRNVAHMAAILDQSKKAQEYVRDFLNKPYIRDFKVGENVKKISVVRYFEDATGESLTTNEWAKIEGAERNKYRRIENYIQVVLCTMQGANSAHTEFMTIDELDVIPKQHKPAYEEAKHIPMPRDGMLPITLLTSTRKFSYGLVQREIDETQKTGLQTRHWNVIDNTERCKPERHRPDLPRVDLWVDDADLRHVGDDDYALLDEQTKKRFVKHAAAFAGCKTCPLFSSCKTRLATHQKSNSPMLKPIPAVIMAFRQASTEHAQTQLLCRKPDTSGLIYARLNPMVHLKTARQIAEMVTGDKYATELSKAQLLDVLRSRGARFTGGMDFGFTHAFVATMGATFGRFHFVTHCISMPGLELDDKIRVSEPFKEWNPTIFGDTEDPASIKTFRRRGFKMKEWVKRPNSVKAGIEIVRMKLMNSLQEVSLFFLKDDPGVEFLVQKLQKYHFLTDAAGEISDVPDDDGDDEADALRYQVMNTFAPNGNLVADKTTTFAAPVTQAPLTQPDPNKDWMKSKIQELTGSSNSVLGVNEAPSSFIKKGRFVFDG